MRRSEISSRTYGTVFIVVLLLIRVAVLGQNVTGTVSGDGISYLAAARHIAQCWCLPPLQGQPFGYAILMAPVVLFLGENAVAGIQSLHLVLDAVAVGLLCIVVDRRLLANAPSVVRVIVLTGIALQPFSASTITPIYTETSVAFLFFLGSCGLAGLPSSRLRWRILGAGALGLAVVLRLDMAVPSIAVLCAALIGVPLIRGSGSRFGSSLKGFHGRAAVVYCAAALVIPAALVLGWQYHSTSEIGWSKGGDYRPGHMAWLRTWFATNGQHEQLAFFYGDRDWPGFSLDNYPNRAFDTPTERKDFEHILEGWRAEGYSTAIDEELQTIATHKERFHGLRPFGTMVVRMGHFWINIDGTQAFLRSGALQPPISTVLVGGVLLLRILLLALAAYGAIRLLIGKTRPRYDAPVVLLAWLCAIAISVRTIELGVLGSFMWAGLMEVRYVTCVYPAWLFLAAFGVAELTPRQSNRIAHE